MSRRMLYGLCAVLLLSFPAQAQTNFDLTLVADGDSRFFDLLAASFAQIIPPPIITDNPPQGGLFEDGYFSVIMEPCPGCPAPAYDINTFDVRSFNPTVLYDVDWRRDLTGDGTPDEFPNERFFQSDYTITYQGESGIGRESVPLSAADFDFQPDFHNGDLWGIEGYETKDESATGTVQLIDGQVAGFAAEVSLTFVKDATVAGVGKVPFYGSLKLEGRRWTLYADTIHDIAGYRLRAVWDGHGYFSNLYETGLPGDYNNDRVVDAADYVVWRDNLGAREGALPNDIDGGDIANLQYLTWRANFGRTLAPGAGSNVAGIVPEPTSVFVLCSGGIGLLLSALYRQSRRNRAARYV